MNDEPLEHGLVSIRLRLLPILLVAALLPWMGVLQALPHHHAESGVPQEELTCLASRPMSDLEHLHSAGDRLHHNPCSTCIAGATTAWTSKNVTVVCGEDEGTLTGSDLYDLRSRLRAQLPLQRGPPATS